MTTAIVVVSTILSNIYNLEISTAYRIDGMDCCGSLFSGST